MLVDMPANAAKVMNKDGFMEIVLRDNKRRYSEFVKVSLSKSGEKAKEAEQIVNKIFSKGNGIGSVRASLDGLTRNMGNMSASLASISENTKNMAASVDSLSKGMSALSAVSYINMALSVVNIGIDVAGFVIVTQKLNALAKEINSIANAIGDMKNFNKNELVSEYDKMHMQYNSIAEKLKNNDTVNLDDIESLLIDMKAYLSKLTGNISDETLNIEVFVSLISALLPAYTALLVEYLKLYYFDKKSIPVNYENYISVFESILSDEIKEKLIDHYFLNDKMNLQDSIDVTNLFLLIVINEGSQVEDQVELLKACDNKEDYLAIDYELEMLARKMVQEDAEESVSELGLDEELALLFKAS